MCGLGSLRTSLCGSSDPAPQSVAAAQSRLGRKWGTLPCFRLVRASSRKDAGVLLPSASIGSLLLRQGPRSQRECTCTSADKHQEEVFHRKGDQILEWAAQDGGGVTGGV